MAAMPVSAQRRLTPDEADAVFRLAAQAHQDDGVAPLSEATLLSLSHDVEPGWHLLARASGRPKGLHGADSSDSPDRREDPDSPGDTNGPVDLDGYARLDRAEDGGPTAAEVVVAPVRRRRGTGRALLAELAADGDVRIWAHGNLPAAQQLAHADGYSVVRELYQMRRPLGPGADPLPEARLPSPFRVRAFQQGRDEDRWLDVNARAFAPHPEQGRLRRRDLDERTSQPWFDPSGFLLVEDERQPDRLAGFHWTKVHPAGAQARHSVGEVYVVGVDPAYQGKGLGSVVTVLGLDHLQRRGLREVLLYVDGDNAAAMSTYRRLGFRVAHVDTMYVRTRSPEVPP